jgi:hypothetical protein
MSEVTELRKQGQTKHSIKFPESAVPIYGSGKVERIQNLDKKKLLMEERPIRVWNE